MALAGMLLALVVAGTILNAGAGDESPGSTATTVTCPPDDAACRAAARSPEPPSIIPQPGSGRVPDDPGDRGGWQQVALLAVVVAALVLIATLALRSARRARHRIGQAAPPGARDP